METRRLEIRERQIGHPISIVGPEDFATTPGALIEPETLLRDPRFSLYCFDNANQSALFVECPDGESVKDATFYYHAQRDHAVAMATMPLGVFHRLAQAVEFAAERLILIHSVGRCGSTLLSKAFQAIPGVLSLSEPDELTQVARLWASKELTDSVASQLVRSSCLWRCEQGSLGHVAIKFRSEVLILARFFAAEFEVSKHVFLYRDGLAWMRTLFRNWPEDIPLDDAVRNRTMVESWSRSIPLIEEYQGAERPTNPVQTRMLAWVACMEAYLELYEKGVPLIAARYEDLSERPEEILGQIFGFCGVRDIDWEAIREVLSRDSQAGTMFDREERAKKNRQLTPELVQDVFDIVASRPLLATPDVILPGTI